MAAIEVEALVKHYRNVHALKGVSLNVEPGEIYALLGRNGAGKTTLVKILLSIVRATGGAARLMGKSVTDPASRLSVGYLPEDPRLPEYHSALSALDVYGALSGVPRNERRRKIPALIERVGLKDAGTRKVRTYSKGMKQRLGLAQAMLHDPQILFLDEPTDGVDPVGRREIRDVLTELKGQGRTIFLNSHLLSEVELVSDRVGIIELGLLRREGRVSEMTVERNIYELKFDRLVEAFIEEIMPRVRGLRRIPGGLELDVENADKLNAVIDFVRGKGVNILSVVQKKQSLEEIFLQTIGQVAS